MTALRSVRLALGVAVVATTLVLGACGHQGPEFEVLQELARNRDRWERLGVDDYRYSVERLCFCGLGGPVRVTVVGGSATERTFVSSGEPVPENQAEWYPTVDALFEVLADAVARDAFSIDVMYDPDTGVPLDIFIDYEENVADEELGFRVFEAPGPVDFLAVR